MNFLSVCSGIEAASVAWEPLGFHAVGYSEIAEFPSAVLQHHYPSVPNFGDFTTIERDQVNAIDILIGGTPCQSFSVAGKQAGLTDPRGNLTLEYIRLLARTKPRWFVWENVPGVLRIDGGRTFGTILGEMGKFGYGFAYRVLDAQYFGVPQRRRRVFVIGCLGSWTDPAKVLFKPRSLYGHNTPIPAQGPGAPQGLRNGADQASRGAGRTERETGATGKAGNGEALSYSPVLYENHANDSRITEAGDVAPTLTSRAGTGGNNQPILRDERSPEADQLVADQVSQTLGARDWKGAESYRDGSIQSMQVVAEGDRLVLRRLTPREYERLQGFPDDYTLIPWGPGGQEISPG